LVYCKMSVGSTHHLEMVFVWKQNYILVDEYFFFCCTWIVNSAIKILLDRFTPTPYSSAPLPPMRFGSKTIW
ncbi:hypothetical protein, partial [Escherichia coli]|uniref:hypothetical protein n=1 Tax=Escherichia coli TaxID=562 RepID=UPI001BD5A519